MKTITSQQLNLGLQIVLFCLVVYFPLFLHLDSLCIRLWDESRLAENAYEMHKNGNYLVTYFDGAPDMWNTKPPLMIWLQVFCMKLLGATTLAVRLPAILAALFTCILWLIFAVKHLKNYWLGMISVLFLVTCNGYIQEHASRTGDYDSLLCFFISAYLFAFYLFVEYQEKKYAKWFFVLLTLAVLTKSVQALVVLPALLLYLGTQKKFFLLKNSFLYKYGFASLAVILGYYLLREHYNPGYLKAVWENELGGRYLTALENNKGDFFYYFQLIMNDHFADKYWLIPCGVAFGLVSKNEQIRKLSIYLSLVSLFYLLVISTAKTKLVWYDMPLYPILSFFMAIAVYNVFDYLKEKIDTLNTLTVNILPYIFLFIVFLSPYEKVINKVYFPQTKEYFKEANNLAYLLSDALHSRKNVKNNMICYQGYQAQLLFYINLLNERQQNIHFKSWESLQANDFALTSQKEIQANIETKYEYEIVHQFENIKKYKIHGPK